MKVLLVLMSLPEEAPYVAYYEYYLKRAGVEINYVIWKRTDNSTNYPRNYFVFSSRTESTKNPIGKMIDMYRYGRFVSRTIKAGNYNKIIVFTVQACIFISKTLLRYKNNYIVDIRDYSPLLKFNIFKNRFYRIIKYSFAVHISSPGFKSFLPQSLKYAVSHNIHPKMLNIINFGVQSFDDNIKILTIGQIRDYSSNYAILDRFANKPNITLVYSGKGDTMKLLEINALNKSISNVLFKGAYIKSEEGEIVMSCDFINAYMPSNFNSSLLLSNRLYLSLIYGKPILVNSNSFQSEVVRKYNLGICLSKTDDFVEKLNKYISDFDNSRFNKGREDCIKVIRQDMNEFRQTIIGFINPE